MEHLTTIIFTTQFLQYLKHHQRSLDKDDIEGIFPLYGSLPSEAKMRDPTITEWENTLEAYLARSEDNGNVLDLPSHTFKRLTVISCSRCRHAIQ